MTEYKNRVQAAMEAFLKKNDPARVKRKNEKPEKLVEVACVEWLKSHRFSGNVVESKAVYSHKAGRYLRGQTDQGVSDWFGNDIFGRACYVEFKAKGKRSTVRESQHKFLLDKILTNCFAVVVDSVDMLAEYYFKWHGLRKTNNDKDARSYLFLILPKLNTPVSDDLFKP